MAICHRFFFGLVPGLRERTAMGLHRDGLVGVKDPVVNARLHLTLAITDDYRDYPTDLEAELRAIGAGIAGDPVVVMLDQIVASGELVALRPSRSSTAVRALQAPLQKAMSHVRLLREGWAFNPHVTLAYRKGAPFSRRVSPIGWESRDVVLVHSVVGQNRHEHLARWPLVALQGSLF